MSKMNFRSALLMSAMAVLPSAFAYHASAQTTPAAAPSVDTTEVIVTARRRSETVMKAPLSITAKNQETLDKQGIKNISDLARAVPSVSFRSNDAFDGGNISIRGVDSTVGSATTAVYINDTPIQSRYICFYCGFTAFPKVFDLERVEVLRGPQGTIYGASSEGGAVRFITPAPSLTQYSSYSRAEISAGEKGEPSWELGGAVGGPIITDKLGFRASLWTRTDGGYIDRVDQTTGDVVQKNSNHEQTDVARVALAFKPTENLTITPSYFYQRQQKDGRNIFVEDAPKFQTYAKVAQPTDDTQKISALDINYDFQDVALKLVSSYYQREQDRVDDYTSTEAAVYGGALTVPGFPDYVAANQMATTQDNFTQEIRLSSKDHSGSKLNWVGGLYFSRSRTAFTQNTVQDFDSFLLALYGANSLDVFGIAPLGPDHNISYFENDSNIDKEIAIFGDATYKITDKLKVSGGLRVAQNEFTFNLHRDGPESGGTVDAIRSDKETPVTPKVSITYDTGTNLFYASASKGYRSGGGNPSVAGISVCDADLATLGLKDVPSTYNSDSVWSYEIGNKGRFFGKKLSVATSVFRLEWDNIQSNVLLPTCAYNYTANLGKAVSQGIETEWQLRPADGLTLSGSVVYTDAHYLDSTTVSGVALTQKGQRRPVPAWTATLASQYDYTLLSKDAYIRADYEFGAGYDYSRPDVLSYDPAINRIEATNLVSVRAGLKVKGADVSLFVNNLFDSQPVLLRLHTLRTTNDFQNISLRPRTIGVTVTYRR